MRVRRRTGSGAGITLAFALGSVVRVRFICAKETIIVNVTTGTVGCKGDTIAVILLDGPITTMIRTLLMPLVHRHDDATIRRMSKMVGWVNWRSCCYSACMTVGSSVSSNGLSSLSFDVRSVTGVSGWNRASAVVHFELFDFVIVTDEDGPGPIRNVNTPSHRPFIFSFPSFLSIRLSPSS